MRNIVMAALAAAALASAAPPARAQIDYRNLDDERPVTTEDAYAIERYAFELSHRTGSRPSATAPISMWWRRSSSTGSSPTPRLD